MVEERLGEIPRKGWEPSGSLFLVLLIGAVLRFFGLSEPQLWLDELLQLALFSQDTLLENLAELTRQVAAAPLDYLVQSAFVRSFGPWELGSRLHAAIFGSLSLPLFYAIVRRILGPREALVATLFLAVYPLHVFYSREGRNYSLFVFLSLLSLHLLLIALRKKTRSSWLYAGGASVLLFYTNYLAVLFVSFEACVVVGLICFPRLGRDIAIRVSRKDLIWFFVSVGGALLVFLPWLILTIAGARADFSEDFLRLRFLLRVWRELSGGSSALSLVLTVLSILAGYGDSCESVEMGLFWSLAVGFLCLS